MLGAIIGDIVGSTREWNNIKTEEFEMVPEGSRFTDDTVMTLAVAKWLMTDPWHREETLVECMQCLGHKYPRAGYGGRFKEWLYMDNPRPYGSYGNGSAMRVSPVGLYATSLEEALELARVTASVTHNHPEGIKGAQAIAAAVYLCKQEGRKAKEKIKAYVERTFGYDLDIKLEKIRAGYTFDVTCQGSVPVAIMAFLQRDDACGALRLAISMGGDSDTIGCMTTSIAMAGGADGTDPDASIPQAVIARCRRLLQPDLLDINDRFEAFLARPLYQSYPLDKHFYAGEYPGDKNGDMAKMKLAQMVHFGVRHFVDLTVEGELNPYCESLPKEVSHHRFPIPDCGTPGSITGVERLLERIESLSRRGGDVYLHCWGGTGRTGMIAACYLASKEAHPTLEGVLRSLRARFSVMPKSAWRDTPDTDGQVKFIGLFIDHLNQSRLMRRRVADCIRGSLMAGAAGDALGYPVEFMTRQGMLSMYGAGGITQFEIDPHSGKALVSDDTQMTLFTANGMLMGLTRGYMRGIGGNPEGYVLSAYKDWYYTQTLKADIKSRGKDTWLRDLPELAHRRAPGSTCMSACADLLERREPDNYSKGCGGIMRVAPMGLLQAAYAAKGEDGYDLERLVRAGAEIAWVTHKHPLGFLPAALLTVFLSKVVPLTVEQVKERIDTIVSETLDALAVTYKGEYEAERRSLRALSELAVRLAHGDMADAEAISKLGEGWVADEAWAIALFCTVRHIDSMKEAIVAAVNHDGDSDSTGSITGNMMGAVYGYEAIKAQRLFCPDGRGFEETLELSNLILALADDLTSGCIISEYDPIDTPEKRQWFARYCEMEPAGIGIADK
ncbi:MAG: ADP-ribosylglycohydrolase family protein [Prevotellaceae bacterium]|nr:ADP-ribosylglycohydrolase family protein [Prevotellaceae bacterium]